MSYNKDNYVITSVAVPITAEGFGTVITSDNVRVVQPFSITFDDERLSAYSVHTTNTQYPEDVLHNDCVVGRHEMSDIAANAKVQSDFVNNKIRESYFDGYFISYNSITRFYDIILSAWP